MTGCRHGGHESHDAAVRLINAAPGARDVSVAVDGQVVWKHSKFGSNTGYHGIKAGSYKVNVDGGAGDSQKDIECVKGKAYTVVNFGKASGPQGQPNLRIFVENMNAPVPRSKARIQFINASHGIGRLDLLFDNIVGFANVPVGSRSAPTVLDSGTYDVKLNKANELRTLAGPKVLHFLPGRSYTLVAMGVGGAGDDPLSLEAYSDSK